eukprot:930474-Pyramimonas_sp.AAC.1
MDGGTATENARRRTGTLPWAHATMDEGLDARNGYRQKWAQCPTATVVPNQQRPLLGRRPS